MFQRPPPLVVDFGPEQTAPGRARRAVEQLLGAGAPLQFAQDAILLTSEIVSNATTVGAGCQLSAWYLPATEHLRVEVFDRSPDMPQVAPAKSPHEISGRGLRIVEMLASKWGVDPQGDGKYVWFEMLNNRNRGATAGA